MPMKEDDYKFMQIVDAMRSINQRVNLIGVVTVTGLPRRTRGSDYFVSVKIVDKSRSSPGLPVNIFNETVDNLPQVTSAGDVILLYHVEMKTHGSEPYALFNKKFSSFALFSGKNGMDFVPYQLSPKFHAREQDNSFITGLRKWVADHHVETGSNDFLSLKDVRKGELSNIICKILHIWEVREDKWMLFVWDGTDTPPVQLITKLADEMENPLPLCLEPFSLPRDTLSTFPDVGTVLRVMVDPVYDKLGISFLKPGKWVKFVNLKCDVRSALWHAKLMPFTRLCYLKDDNDHVLQQQRDYEERMLSKWGWAHLSSFPWPSNVTETDFPSVPFVSLKHAQTYQQALGKFRCVVRVVAALPWRVEDLRSPSEIYRVRLTLEDATARIHAFLCADDGVVFFERQDSIESMKRKWNMLLGILEEDCGGEVMDAARNPPWVDCCLKSYYLDENDIWGSRQFRIFSTRLSE